MIVREADKLYRIFFRGLKMESPWPLRSIKCATFLHAISALSISWVLQLAQQLYFAVQLHYEGPRAFQGQIVGVQEISCASTYIQTCIQMYLGPLFISYCIHIFGAYNGPRQLCTCITYTLIYLQLHPKCIFYHLVTLFFNLKRHVSRTHV